MPKTELLEDRIVAFAEQVGRMIGTTEAKTADFLDRTHLADQLARIRDEATDLLHRMQPARKASRKPAAQRTNSPAPMGAADRDPIHARGKKHRAPTPTERGVKHSDERVAKARQATTARARRRG